MRIISTCRIRVSKDDLKLDQVEKWHEQQQLLSVHDISIVPNKRIGVCVPVNDNVLCVFVSFSFVEYSSILSTETFPANLNAVLKQCSLITEVNWLSNRNSLEPKHRPNTELLITGTSNWLVWIRIENFGHRFCCCLQWKQMMHKWLNWCCGHGMRLKVDLNGD